MSRGRHSGRRAAIDPGPRPSVAEPRLALLAEVLAFVRAAADCPAVRRIALVGSLATTKPIPKDADLLVTVDPDADLESLGVVGRRFRGRCQAINLGADIFLCDTSFRYLGRICPHRVCHHRASCEARSCGVRQGLRDDLDVITLSGEILSRPPFVLWPTVTRETAAPMDVEAVLLSRLERWLQAPPASA